LANSGNFDVYLIKISCVSSRFKENSMGIKATAIDIQAKESTNEEHSKVKNSIR
jgi:hypothetical protein